MREWFRRNWKQTSYLLVVVAMAIMLFGAIYVIMRNIFSGLSPNIASALVTALAGIFIVVASQYFHRMQSIKEAHRDKKVELYSAFVDMLVDITMRVKDDEEYEIKEDAETTQRIQDFHKEFLLWSGPNVIKSFMKFKRVADETDINPAHSLLRVDRMLREIRADLGLSNRGLRRGEIVKIFLRDPEELDRYMTRR